MGAPREPVFRLVAGLHRAPFDRARGLEPRLDRLVVTDPDRSSCRLGGGQSEAFCPAASDESYISKAVFGERFWASHDQHEIPPHHVFPIKLLNGIAMFGAIFLVWGLAAPDVWVLLFEFAVSLGGKMWFIHRIVWLYRDMVATDSSLRYIGV